MKIKLKLITIMMSLGVFLTGCTGNGPKTNPSPPPERTVVKFIVQANDKNQARFLIKTPKGPIDINDLLAKSKNPVKAKKGKNSNEQDFQDIIIRLVSGSCTAEVCLPDRPCFPVIIDPVNDCPDF